MVKYCVLIPSYNEAKTIGSIISDLKSRGIITYVVDDGSSDDTYQKASSAGAIVIKHDRNKGKGASLREGFGRILKEDFGAVLIMDGDNQHEVSSIPDFLREMDETGADMVIGNRMDNSAGMPLVRRLTNRFMSSLISWMSGQYVPDTQCGFRLIKKIVLELIILKSSNFEIESELIIRAAKKGFRISSVPIRAVYEDEESRINPVVDTIRFIAFVIKTSFDK